MVTDMSSLIMSNGEYGESHWYELQKNDFHHILCTDGAAAKARKWGMIPDVVVGDMDSIHPEDLDFMEKNLVKIHRYPTKKDYTDTFLALLQAEENKWDTITVWGGTGGRLDHTLANLLGTLSFVRRGMRLVFDSPELTISMIGDYLELLGTEGNTVSLFPMGGKATGVTLDGFKYPLKNALLDPELPIGISNILTKNEAHVSVESGILAVFHYK